tara:strand:- start:2885 stop:3196 length:312 start_codon:yes stop_codon:yes gene_type:complete
MAYHAQGLIQLGFVFEEDFYTIEKKGVVELVWKSDKPQPTEVECEAAKAEYDAQEYARNRQAEYPSLDSLVVAMWEGVVEERMASVTRLEGLRQAVKTKYPKE